MARTLNFAGCQGISSNLTRGAAARLILLSMGVLPVFALVASPIGTVETREIGGSPTQVYAISVSAADYPRTAPYDMTAEEVSVLVASGLPLWKEGTGAVNGNDEMASFAGDIYVKEGVYRVTTAGALGTTAGATRVIGGTLESCLTGSWDWGGTNASFGAEPIFIEGEGCNGLGAIYASSQSYKLYAGTLTLTGDALMTGDADVSMRGSSSTFNGGGHTFTVAMNKGKIVDVMAGTFTNLHEFVFTKGTVGLSHGLGVKTLPEATFRVKSGVACRFDGLKGVLSSLVLEDGVRMTSGSDQTHISRYTAGELPGAVKGAGYATNVWAGAVVLEGAVTNQLSKGVELTISGPVSGSGRFVGGSGGYLRLVNAANTFAGANGFSGVVEDGAAVGGLELMNTNSVVYSHNVPLAFTNANLAVYSAKPAPLTMDALSFDVASAGATSVLRGSSNPGSSTVAASLLKTGAGTLEISRPLTVSGATEVRGGTLRFACPAGGLEYFNCVFYVATPEDTGSISKGTYLETYSPRSKAYQTLTNSYTRVGVDSAGATMTFAKWEGNELVFSDHAYAGEIFVPGDASDTVTWNFASRFQRGVWIEIDGQTVFDLRDIKQYDAAGQNVISQTDYSMRFLTSPPFTLTGGWHSIFVSAGNNYGRYNYTSMGPCGKYSSGDLQWNVDYLGVALNKRGTCTSNSADYVALKDPGDGSFLRLSDAQKRAIDPACYRPVFGGPVTFAGGTVFDIGDREPYVPVCVTNGLFGATEVRNGVLEVASAWTLDAAAIAADHPLEATGGAGISFAAGATLVLPDDGTARRLRGKALVSADASSTVSGRENLVISTPGAARAKWSDDGKTLTLLGVPGFSIILR